MVQFPAEYIQLDKFPGYYWNTITKSIYSIKVGGILTPLKFHKPFYINGKMTLPGYKLSLKGRRYTLTSEAIDGLLAKYYKSGLTLQIVPTK